MQTMVLFKKKILTVIMVLILKDQVPSGFKKKVR